MFIVAFRMAVGYRNSMRVDEGHNALDGVLSRLKSKAQMAVGSGVMNLLSDPGAELPLGWRRKRKAKRIRGIANEYLVYGNKKWRSTLYLAVCLAQYNCNNKVVHVSPADVFREALTD